MVGDIDMCVPESEKLRLKKRGESLFFAEFEFLE